MKDADYFLLLSVISERIISSLDASRSIIWTYFPPWEDGSKESDSLLAKPPTARMGLRISWATACNVCLISFPSCSSDANEGGIGRPEDTSCVDIFSEILPKA